MAPTPARLIEAANSVNESPPRGDFVIYCGIRTADWGGGQAEDIEHGDCMNKREQFKGGLLGTRYHQVCRVRRDAITIRYICGYIILL